MSIVQLLRTDTTKGSIERYRHRKKKNKERGNWKRRIPGVLQIRGGNFFLKKSKPRGRAQVWMVEVPRVQVSGTVYRVRRERGARSRYPQRLLYKSLYNAIDHCIRVLFSVGCSKSPCIDTIINLYALEIESDTSFFPDLGYRIAYQICQYSQDQCVLSRLVPRLVTSIFLMTSCSFAPRLCLT